MNENIAKKQMLRDARIILGTIAVVSFIFRFWIVIIPAILGVFVTSIILCVIKIREINKKAVVAVGAVLILGTAVLLNFLLIPAETASPFRFPEKEPFPFSSKTRDP